MERVDGPCRGEPSPRKPLLIHCRHDATEPLAPVLPDSESFFEAPFKRIENCKVKDAEVNAIFFRNLKPHEPFLSGTVSLDYSLQLADGISNWHAWFRESYPELYEQRFPSSPASNARREMSPKEISGIPVLPLEQTYSRGEGKFSRE